MSEMVKREGLLRRIISNFKDIKDGFANMETEEIEDPDLKNPDQNNFFEYLNELRAKTDKMEEERKFNRYKIKEENLNGVSKEESNLEEVNLEEDRNR